MSDVDFSTPISPDDQAEYRKRRVVEAQKNFDDSVKALLETLLDSNPLQILAMFYFRFNFAVNPFFQVKRETSELEQHHLELLQGLALRHDLSVFKKRQVDPAKFVGLISKASLEFFFKRQGTAAFESDQEMAKAQLVEEVRIHTQAVRNPAYYQFMQEILDKIANRLDSKATVLGIKYDTVVGFLRFLTRLYGQRYFDFIERIQELKACVNKDDCFSKFKQNFTFADRTGEKIDYLKTKVNEIELDDLKLTLGTIALEELPFIFTMDTETIKEFYPENIDEVERLLESWSLQFGDLSEIPIEHLFMGNPVKSKPFIKFEKGRYFLPIPSLLISNADELLKSVAISRNAQGQYEDSRSRVLEQLVVARMETVFGIKNVFAGCTFKLESDSTEYENDVLATHDNVALFAEAKSRSINEGAKRGGDQIFNEIKKLVTEPVEQGLRFASYLRKNPGPITLKTRRGHKYTIDARSITRSIILPVTLDALSNRWNSGLLLKSGAIKPDIVKWPPIYVGDLLAITEILGSPKELLHYLKFRSDFAAHDHVVADELDLLGYYLHGERGLPEPEDGVAPTFIGLTGFADEIDQYFYAEDAGAESVKPTHNRTEWFDRVIQAAFKDEQTAWTETVFRLMDVPRSMQIELDSYRNNLLEQVKADAEPKQCKSAVLIPTDGMPFFLGVFVCKGLSIEDLAMLGERRGQISIGNSNHDFLGIAVDIDQPNVAYKAVMLLKHPNKEES